MTASVGAATHLRTISRELAHRCAVSEVFVTSLDDAGSGEFVVGAQLPRMHAYYGDHVGSLAARHDPLLVMEAARQAALAVSHEFYGVPPEMAFIVRTFNGAVVDGAAWEIGPAPADLVMSVRAPRQHRQDGVLHGLDMVLDIECDGTPMLTVDGSFSWTTPARWARLRSGFRESLGLGPFRGAVAPAEQAVAATVGRENRRNVVIGPPSSAADGSAAAVIVADTTHPFLFDHQLDHVPGSLLLEACRQLGLTLVGGESPRLAGIASTFEKFVELDLPAECRAVVAEREVGRTLLHCEIEQTGAITARIELEFAEGA
ncbi:ScbA/BarX family gamma-butyrolactone biosynthesis protein [Nocardia arthritidis]|uniref:Gamma-butyrolactone biosynthesis protein n=1 Tax=Nocardia arthritidis TaxID=228602 RepID=A0A6G9YAN8_9NOCA|nr:ScbA/BarX family gamma-butyrolactone biosynthesis protein [Nocardia arthritidis]QIS10228.1 gamma-butyrolactone biosynthesis protein [Nocardia arthritidis]